MKKLLILLFSLSLFGLNAQNKQTKKERKANQKKEQSLKEFVPASHQYQKNKKQIVTPKNEVAKTASPPGFEGSVTLTNTDKKGLAGLFLVEGKQVSATIPGPMNSELKYLIQNNERTEIQLTKQKGKKVAYKQRRVALQMPAGLVLDKKDKGQKKVTKTGKTKTIAGYNCQEVQVKDNVTQLHAWVTTDIPVNFDDLMPKAVNSAEYLSAVNSRDGIMNAMLIEATQKEITSGKSFTITAQVEKKKIKDKEFKVPNGYRLVDQTRMSTKARSISPAASVGAAQNKAKNALKQMEAAKKAAAGEAAPATPIKE